MATDFRVWCPERGHEGPEDGDRVHSYSAESAATDWAYRDDYQSDYSIVQGNSVDVSVQRADGTGPIERFRVRGETERVYYARKL